MVLWALIKKEFYQIVRDPSSILIAFVLPAVLLIIYMYGINLDTTKVTLGIVNEDRQHLTEVLTAGFDKSRYLNVVRYAERQSAYQDLNDSKIRGLVIIPSDFCRQIGRAQPATLQVIADGSESNTANFVYIYVRTIVNSWYLNEFAAGRTTLSPSVESSYWYNQELNSHHSILPGSLAITMTLIGILLTGLVVAREWERGTMESLLAAGVSKLDLVLGKYIPYYLLGMASMLFNVFICVVIFDIPFRGSLLSLFVFSSFFLCTCLGAGLLISTKFKSQLLAGQFAFIIGFLPSLLLCGLMFPVQSMPPFFQELTKVIPARYFVLLLQNEFLVGTSKSLVLENSAYLLLLSAILFLLIYKSTPKRL